MKNYYQILGITTDAEPKAIRKAWLKKAQQLHPDHNPDDPTSEEQFKEIQEAYRILSDPFLRDRYNQGSFETIATSSTAYSRVTHYFYSHAADTTIKVFEEFQVTFTYTGQGRVFIKPTFEGFFLTGSPYVSHRMIIHEGVELKETTFTYVICPIRTGSIEVTAASIRIHNKEFTSEPLLITVISNKCHFTDNELADGKPLKFPLHYAFQLEHTSEQKKNHILLIPRSKTAFSFHQIGRVMKIVFTIWGGVVFPLYFNLPFLAGCLAGNSLGGINCMIMYHLAGVKSKFSYALKYSTALEYLEKGYKPGESTGLPLVESNIFFAIQRLLI